MKNSLMKNDELSIGFKGTWINAKGHNAQLITFGLFIMFILIGVATIKRNNI